MKYWDNILKEILCKRRKKNNCLSMTSCSPCSPDASPVATKSVSSVKKTKNHILGGKFPGIYLTQREAECMSNFINNKTVTETASFLNLSPRTVEFYLKNMKTKLECKTKSELIYKIKESDFHKNYIQSLSTADDSVLE